LACIEPDPPVLGLRADGLAWHEVEGEVIAIDVDAAVYLAANGSGALLWKLLVPGATRGELVTALAEEYGLDTATSEADVDAFLGQLEEQGLLADRT
jgi:hypothetical protein